MGDLHGHSFSELLASLNAGQHLAVDAVVAFVDGELRPTARSRAAAHLAICPSCAAEVAAQRQARSVVRSAACPQVPAGLLAALRDIPQTADLPDLPGLPDVLAVAEDGTLVTPPEPGRRRRPPPLGGSPPLGAGPRWGYGPSVLRGGGMGRGGEGRGRSQDDQGWTRP